MEQKTETERKECPGCYGKGWIRKVDMPDDYREQCPACSGDGNLPADMRLYTFYNVNFSRLMKEIEPGTVPERTTLRFPDDYAINAVIEADSLGDACRVAKSRGVPLSPFTVVEQPDGSLFAPATNDVLCH
jgi:hypothetical protein